MQLTINTKDEVLRRFGNRLQALGEDASRTIMSRTLNHEGTKARTMVKRSLAAQTGLKAGAVNSKLLAVKSTTTSLTYILTGRGDETNVAHFKGVQRKGGVSAAPWNRRTIFKGSFMLYASKGKQGLAGSGGTGLAMIRTKGSPRLPIREVYGPNLAREMVKDETASAFRRGSANIPDRVAHEIDHFLRK